MPQDLHELPKLRDSLSYLYVEHAIIERKDSAVEMIKQEGRVHIPAAALCVLILGPGTNITHAAVKVLAECGCTILWTGEEMTRFYAHGSGETRKAYHLLHQAEMVSLPEKRMQVVLRMYQKRFATQLEPGLTLPQIRGFEGVRVREAFAQASHTYSVPWHGRRYDRSHWDRADTVNRALSAANSLLNSLCHAAIVSGGYSPALGFIHTGKLLSFVYDIADLYKVELTIPVAFQTVAQGISGIEQRTRQACRERFHEVQLLHRILPDIDELLQIPPPPLELEGMDTDPSIPTDLWEALFSESELPS